MCRRSSLCAATYRRVTYKNPARTWTAAAQFAFAFIFLVSFTLIFVVACIFTVTSSHPPPVVYTLIMTELWLTYHQASRAQHAPTSQLVELDTKTQKLQDLEDVLDHIFRQGFLDAKLRPVAWWEKASGERVKSSAAVAELLQQGVGKCQETAMRLVIGTPLLPPSRLPLIRRHPADVPPALWFTYHYTITGKNGATQRVKLDALAPFQAGFRPKLAHVTNHVFAQGFLAAHLRSRVHWEGVCGKPVAEHSDLFDLLCAGEGMCEEKPMKLVIGALACPIPLARMLMAYIDDAFLHVHGHCHCH